MSKGQWRKPGGPGASAEIGPGDPARGEKVPRCARCGMPERPAYKLYPGLWGYIRFNLDLTLCGQCIEELADKRGLDPIQLEDVA
jgi:ribosomal protein S14